MGQTSARPESVLDLLDELEATVGHARAMPMSASALVNRSQVLDLIDRIRAAIPTSVSSADRLLSSVDVAVADARNEADGILAAARAQAAKILDADELVVAARERAATIVTQAETTATALRCEAEDYCDRRLGDFEIDLGRIQAQVRKGREKLAELLDEQSAETGRSGRADRPVDR